MILDIEQHLPTKLRIHFGMETSVEKANAIPKQRTSQVVGNEA